MSLNRIGYPCVSLLTGRTTNHETILRTATPERLRGLIARNLADLQAILTHNLEHDWRLFRIGSSFIPFASHPINTIPWWCEFKEELTSIGRFVRTHNMRLSLHPGQFTVLNSPNPKTVQHAIAELMYSARLLDQMGLDSSHKIVIHIGGSYGDKAAAMRRFCQVVRQLPEFVRARLTIENDERIYTPADVLHLSRQTGLPVVFDNLHYQANPGPGNLDSLLADIFHTWQGPHGLPKVHFSSQDPCGRLGQHARLADPEEFRSWLARWSQIGPFDLMLEAKEKDRALLSLRPIYAPPGASQPIPIAPVKQEVL